MAQDGVQMNISQQGPAKLPTGPGKAKPITRSELSDPVFLERKFNDLASKGKIVRSESSRRRVFAAAAYAVRKGTNPGGLFHHLVLGRGQYEIPDMDDDRATELVKSLDCGFAHQKRGVSAVKESELDAKQARENAVNRIVGKLATLPPDHGRQAREDDKAWINEYARMTDEQKKSERMRLVREASEAAKRRLRKVLPINLEVWKEHGLCPE
jgi:hypothetical protein